MLLATCFFSDEQVASKRAKGAAEQRVTLIVLQLFTYIEALLWQQKRRPHP